MTDKFDPATHCFGMAYIDSNTFRVYPFNEGVNHHGTIGCLWIDNDGSFLTGRSFTRNMVRAPEHDLIPRPTAPTCEERKAALEALNMWVCDPLRFISPQGQLTKAEYELCDQIKTILSALTQPSNDQAEKLADALKSSNAWLKLLMDSLSVDPSTCIEIKIDGVKQESTLQKCLNRSSEALAEYEQSKQGKSI